MICLFTLNDFVSFRGLASAASRDRRTPRKRLRRADDAKRRGPLRELRVRDRKSPALRPGVDRIPIRSGPPAAMLVVMATGDGGQGGGGPRLWIRVRAHTQVGFEPVRIERLRFFNRPE